MDEQGLSRVEQRLKQAQLPSDAKHPIVLTAVTMKNIQQVHGIIVIRIIYDCHSSE